MSLSAAWSAAFAARSDPELVPAASVAVVVGDDEAAAEWGVQPGTLFQAASISKPVAALVTLRLAARGMLALDDDVNHLLTSWQLPNETGLAPVTVRHLLCHGGALTVSGVPGYQQGQALPGLTEILDGLPPANTPAVRRDGPPGLEWQYSGGGYVLLQQILEDVSGQPFAELAAELVFRPAGMDSATYAQPALPDGAAAHAGGQQVHWRVYPELATAGLWCTPSDLVRFAQTLQAAAAGADGALLPRKLALDMMTPQLSDWGLGLRVSDSGAQARFSHGGENYGYECALIGTVFARNAAAVMISSDRGIPLISSLLAAIPAHTSWRELPSHREGPVW
jgi:CubicO group peptidase (beta-lactamase class C family)